MITEGTPMTQEIPSRNGPGEASPGRTQGEGSANEGPPYGVSINGETPKWLVYNGKSPSKTDDRG